MFAGFLDRLAVALRPSLATCLLLLATGLGLAVGGTATAAALLALAYTLYRWGTASSPDAVRQYNSSDRQYNADGQYNEDRQYIDDGLRQYNAGRTAAVAAEPGGAGFNTKQQQQQGEDGDESAEGFYEPGYEPGFSGVGFEGSSVPGVGVEAGYFEAEESEVREADKVSSGLGLLGV
jgi:hypothetical protein